MPLVLQMKPDEEIHIDGPCVLKPAWKNATETFKVAFEAPRSTTIRRLPLGGQDQPEAQASPESH